jgi:hypothetical protein
VSHLIILYIAKIIYHTHKLSSINRFTTSARIHLGACWPKTENIAVYLVMYMYITCSTCKPPNVAPICCNFLTCRLGEVPAHYTKCITYPRVNFALYFNKPAQTQVNLHTKKKNPEWYYIRCEMKWKTMHIIRCQC